MRVVFVIFFLLCFCSCVATSDGERAVDLGAVNQELRLLVLDLEDLEALAAGSDWAMPIGKVRVSVALVQGALQEYLDGGGELAGVLDAIDLALEVTTHVLDEVEVGEDMRVRVQVGLTAVKMVLRRVRVYLG